MLHGIHQKLGTAGFILSIVALVAALSGGAYAATQGLSGKEKKEVEKIAKKYAGKPGAAGTNGSNGTAGAKGDAGAQGSQGSQGSQGTPGTAGAAGKEGSPWTAGGVLPKGKTETGVFGWNNAQPGEPAHVPISFTIPLAAPLGPSGVHLLKSDGSKEIVFNEGTFETEEVNPTGCGTALTPAGTAASPAAAAGNLCVYVTTSEPVLINPAGENAESGSNFIFDPAAECSGLGCVINEVPAGTGRTGARIEVVASAGSAGFGAWAVTAP